LNQFRPSTFKILPDVVKNLLIINGLFFLATIVIDSAFHYDLTDVLGLHYIGAESFQVHQFVTHMFMHGGASAENLSLMHIFSNMFSLWMFGSTIENYWGPKKFLIYYLVTGLGAGLIYSIYVWYDIYQLQQGLDFLKNNPSPHLFTEFVNSNIPLGNLPKGYVRDIFNVKSSWVNNPDSAAMAQKAHELASDFVNFKLNMPMVGASGAVFGILIAFGMLFPNLEIMFIFLPIPIKAKYFVLGYGVFELYNGFQNNPADNVAHFAHLGGMLIGYFLIKFWNSNRNNHQYNR